MGAGQVCLKTAEAVGDYPVAGLDVAGVEHGADVLQRHVQITKAAEDLGGDDLLRHVAPVPDVSVDLRALRLAKLVEMTKRPVTHVERRTAPPATDRSRGPTCA
jgi:hypothetical protein